MTTTNTPQQSNNPGMDQRIADHIQSQIAWLRTLLDGERNFARRLMLQGEMSAYEDILAYSAVVAQGGDFFGSSDHNDTHRRP